MSNNNKMPGLVTVPIALLLAAGCHKDAADAAKAVPATSATPSATASPTPSSPPAAGTQGRAHPLTAARLYALQMYDINHDGQLDAAEQERMEADRRAQIEAVKARFYARYDRNGNGVLEPNEARAIQTDTDKRSIFKGAALRRYDANHNGVLDPAENQLMMTEREAFLKKMQGRLLAKYDTNHDGKLDTQERAVMDRQLAPAAR